jgi:hypothetical protein
VEFGCACATLSGDNVPTAFEGSILSPLYLADSSVLRRRKGFAGAALVEGWEGVGEKPHFSQRTPKMGHPDLSITDCFATSSGGKLSCGDRMPTQREFIEDWPLYTRAEILNFDPPNAISRRYEGECEKETTWSQIKTVAVSTMGTSSDFQAVSYVCNLRGREYLIVLYRKIDWHRKPELGPAPHGYYSINEWQHGAVQKIGQVPAVEVVIP